MLVRLGVVLVCLSVASAPLACSDSVHPGLQGAANGEMAGAAGAWGGAGGDGGASISRGIPVCEAPQFDAASQLIVCASGFAHRLRPSDCESQAGAANADPGARSSAGAAGVLSDADVGYGAPCDNDSQCSAGMACACNPLAYLPDPALVTSGRGACVPATCRTDADCGTGSYCAVGNLTYLGEALPGFSCLRADDECTTDADCDSTDRNICLERTRRTCSLPPE